MSPAVTLPHSLPLGHHLSEESKSRQPSAMKMMAKLMSDPGLVSLGGGMPHSSLFPLSHASFTIPAYSSLGDVSSWAAGEAPTQSFELFKNAEGGVVDISRGLQYGLSNGFEELIEPLHEMTQLIHNPPYADCETVLTLGCTDGVNKVFTLFCDRGDNVLCEEFTFSNSLNSGRAKGVVFHGVEVDTLGMVPASLEKVISTWDVSVKGKKPTVLYTIPCGQNPTGTCPSQERYDEIYAIAQKHDLIIMEDDPYHPLQFQPYTSDLAQREAGHVAAQLPPLPAGGPQEDDVRAVAQAFNDYAGVRSFLSRDVDGRVVRLDSFSKFFAPGARCGWISCNSTFAERLLRIGETNTQVPNGIGQSMLASYFSPVHGWGVAGMLRWIFSVRIEYERKRDFFVDNVQKYCDPKYIRTTAAMGGMFQWIEVDLRSHKRFTEISPAPATGPATNTVELMQELFQYLVSKKLLILPGAAFSTPPPAGQPNVEGIPHVHDRSNFFRATYAGTCDQIAKGMEILGREVKIWFETDVTAQA